MPLHTRRSIPWATSVLPVAASTTEAPLQVTA